MLMGQVWSKGSFDGTDAAGHRGGRGSVLAVTAQHDAEPAPLNARPVWISLDASTGSDCDDSRDRVRNFTSFHKGGALFLFGDGRVRFINETIDSPTYRALSTIVRRDTIGGY